ncbi:MULTISPECIES: amidase [Streptomycetaceae]|uniref:Amidase n=1 Tax=Streptantibioticus cattleyicolor (strain ATCC 35852 / DSM 46488 / JCM 4925 / NBRC 14057 / NRRL 8057) TaxID=1003195 RepID=F8K412_STREN|nr:MULTISPECIES: amidase [Streptomycetaceae]AEW92549.1 amidase [Streptantibioticus cattleyicolor NRRL 8057 = DSM 46488]MYS57338.1 amidase [Streptomyces sp. SID5468]CCB72906.1 putative amidase [Streptantibioticus cattleyicolor NRRL 8057 = DSM 46488]
MRVAEYVNYDAVGLAELVAEGEVTPDELQAAAIEATQAVNPQINAVVETWPTDDVPKPGSTPLAGVPFLVKDIGVSMAGRRMELGSRLAAGNVARADSFLMLRLRRAGLVTFGRTATSEMAYSITTEPVLYGATRNPWNLERSAGGSSGGAGAAVAAGVVSLAHGTDAAGSLRIPAAYNGLFGLKPTRGRVSMGPDFDEVFSGLAVHGSVSRTVRDSAALLDQIRGAEPGDPYFAQQPSRPYTEEVTRHPGRLRIGVLTQAWGGRRTTAPVADALSRTTGLLESLGHQVEEAGIGLGADWEEYVLANAHLFTANLVASLDELAAAFDRPIDSSTLEPATLAGYHYGQRVSGAQFVAAFTIRNRVARSLARCFDTYDIVLTPTVPELPTPLGAYAESAQTLDGLGWIDRVFDRSPFTMPFNMAGTPAMSVPLTADAGTGLPIGMQFAAGYGFESRLFRLAGQLEQASPWSGRIPPVWAGNRTGH